MFFHTNKHKYDIIYSINKEPYIMSLVKTENITIASLVGITGLASILLTLPTVSAETEAVDTVTITVPSACSMSSTITTGNEHTATVDSGTYQAGIGETSLKTICNDSNGFSIYAIGYTDNTYGNTKLKSSVGTISDVVTGTATSGNTSNWAMKLTAGTGTYAPTIETDTNGSFANYHVIPDSYTKVATFASTTDAINGSTLTTTYAVFMKATQPAGTYEGKVKYTLVHPASHSAPEPPQGLCTDVNTCMQQQTSASLAQKLPNVGSTTTLYDSRDNQAYTVAKLADNKYWMVENLNLTGGTALSADDTDVTSAYISSFSTSNNLTKTGNTLVLPASSNSEFDTNNYSYVYNSGNKTNCGAYDQNTPCYSYYSWDATTLGSGRSISTDNTDAPYSICPKGWKLPTSRTTSATNWQTTSDFYQLAHQYGLDSTTSTSENDNGFYTQAGPGTTPNFLLAGYYYSGSFFDGGSYGFYWSATSCSSTSNARNLNFSSSSVNSANYYGRYYGFSVRCVFSAQ